MRTILNIYILIYLQIIYANIYKVFMKNNYIFKKINKKSGIVLYFWKFL